MVFFWTADYSKYSQRQPKELGHHPNHPIQLGHHPNHHFSFLYIFLTIYYNWYILSRMVHITIYCKDVLVSSNFNKMYWTAANWAKKCTGQQYIQGERKRGWYLGRGGCAWLCRRAWVASTYAPALFHLYPADRERMRWIRSVAHAFYKL